MEKEICTFSNPEFGSITTIMIDNEPWFIGNEVASLLGYENQSRDVSRHVDNDDRILLDFSKYQNGTLNPSGRGNKKRIIINESGLYSLILSSKLPQAKKFKRWVTSEVLPAIRKHGAYLTPDKIEEVLLNPDTIIKTFRDKCRFG